MPQKSFGELTPEEVLILAIDVEEGNGIRLRTFADLFNDYSPEAAGFFAQMAYEEDQHSLRLKTAYERRYGELRQSVTEKDVQDIVEPFDLDDAEHHVFGTLTLRRTLEALLTTKQQAQGFYRQALEKADEGELQALFRELADFEADHLQWIEARLDALGESA